METAKKHSVLEFLEKYEPYTDSRNFIEVTEWIGSNGFDLAIEADGSFMIPISWGQFQALVKVANKLKYLIDTE